MHISHDQFIGVYKNVLSKEWCNSIINIFEENIELTREREKKRPNDDLRDLSIDLSEIPNTEDKVKESISYIQKAYELFNKKYPHTPENYDINGLKIQKTLPTEGYHIWHSEVANWLTGDEYFDTRFAVYTIYLNDINEGGETEFLYQSKRVPPTTGTISIFPAYYTHTHRGNPPLVGVKYIMTGWFLLKDFSNE